jgi:uncharacterized protein YndB with AHSA1/START domain
MLGVITQSGKGAVANFERRLGHGVEEVWAYLTENGKLQQWFPELHVDGLREGGVIKFDMGNGTFEEMTITALSLYETLAFTWAEDHVRFELSRELEGCRLTLIETITAVNSHTPRDLAGWHVCLDVIGDLLDGKPGNTRRAEWEGRYREYAQLLGSFK